MSSATYERSRRSAILAEVIKQLIQNTLRKERNIPTPTELDVALEPPLIFRFYIYKPKQDSLLHYIAVNTPPIVRTFCYLHETELRNILKYAQTPGLVNESHALVIDLMAAAAVKHYLWKTEHNFKAEELHLNNTCSKDLKRPFVNPRHSHPGSVGNKIS